ncbi:Bgt-50002 [Blumeria graminis f. sp. tritici]|uniref:Bgt-50002 n=1 Tax=Blumeria graminis f. sp. tritici TaxID=62690 RepID=A0A9X9PR19_BLUGR|nr:Bgt-50002 [Blumeria graminis f. sp. tritici]
MSRLRLRISFSMASFSS